MKNKEYEIGYRCKKCSHKIWARLCENGVTEYFEFCRETTNKKGEN